jgi:DNA-binding transcriptional LysR family regulator
MAGLEWDDLRFVLAVANAGSLAGAARNLNVNHTTVLRRVSAFEKRVGLRLFERLPSGYVLTPGGEELIAAARHLEDTIIKVERKLAGQDARLSGSLRVTTTDTLMASILPRMLAEFRAAHSGVQIEIAVSNLMFNLSKRDADVAIRPAKDPPETLVGRRMAKVAFAIYGSPDYWRNTKRSIIWRSTSGSVQTTVSRARRSRNGCDRNCPRARSRFGQIRSSVCGKRLRRGSDWRHSRAI